MTAGRTTYELSADEARTWDGITDEIGARLLPVLERLVRSMPTTTGALVATADGFNLCALGLPADRVERICADLLWDLSVQIRVQKSFNSLKPMRSRRFPKKVAHRVNQ